MNVNSKGEAGLIEVIRDLQRKGYECFMPFGDSSAIDLIAVDATGRPIRLQVKYRSLYRNRIELQFRSVVNGKIVPIDLNKIDGWAVFCPDIARVVYVQKSEVDLSKGAVNFRLTHTSRSAIRVYDEFTSIENWMGG